MTPASTPSLGFLQLVAEPHRWRVLQELNESDRRVGELTELLGESQNLVSYHLGQLRDAGLVSSRRSSADGRDSYYRIEPARLSALLGKAGAELVPGAGFVSPAPDDHRVVVRRRVLFLCTGNSSRSQMAEALVEQRTAGRIAARSAGSHPKPLHPHAVRVMAARGIDLSGRRPKHIDRVREQRFDRVITLCDKVREVCLDLPGRARASHWSIADPAADGGLDAFERCAVEIEERIGRLVIQMAAEDGRG